MRSCFLSVALWTCSVLCIGGWVKQASAEGAPKAWGGNHGVNRVIRTDSTIQDYSACGATVDMSFSMPIVDITVAGGTTVTAASDPYNNKPSPYLGGRTIAGANVTVAPHGLPPYNVNNGNAGAPIEVDAGLQFETGLGNAAGWTAFISYNGTYVTPKVFDAATQLPKPWRGGLPNFNGSVMTGHINTDMSFNVTPAGGTSLTIGALARFFGIRVARRPVPRIQWPLIRLTH